MLERRQGVTRVVYLTKKYAIKFPRIFKGWKMFIQGMFSNLSEYECWKCTESEFLCPVLYSFGGFFIIMPRVTTDLTMDEINKALPDEDPGEDRHWNNYGRLNGKIVCIDYPYHRIKPYKR